MPVFHTQNVLNGGEISPLLRGRVDQPRYSTGAREMSNFVPMPQGGVTRRPGTRYLGTALGDDGRLVPFVFSATQGRMLEFGDRAMLVWLPDGRVVTGKTGNLLGAASALLMNALKGVSGVDDELYVISDDVLEPICHLKTEHLKSHNPRLHSDETLLALSISSVHNPLAAELIDNADKLRGCDAYFSVIISAADEKLYKTLGINVCCEPKYEQHRFYHK